MKSRTYNPPANQHIRIFYRFEEYKILDNRFYYEVVYCPGIRDFWGDGKYGDEWRVSLYKWNSKIAHWQYDKTDKPWKAVFKENHLKSLKVLKTDRNWDKREIFKRGNND